jgi:hypothetical protein
LISQRFKFVEDIHAVADQFAERAILWAYDAEMRDEGTRDIIIQMVNLIQEYANWCHFPNGLTVDPPDLADAQESRERHDALNRVVRHTDSVLMPLRVKFNALAIQVLKGRNRERIAGTSDRINKCSLAITILGSHPKLSITGIANKLGVNREDLYRKPEYEAFRNLAERLGRIRQGGKNQYRIKGYKSKDGNIEAYQDD